MKEGGYETPAVVGLQNIPPPSLKMTSGQYRGGVYNFALDIRHFLPSYFDRFQRNRQAA